MVVRISDKTQNYSKVTKLLVKPNKKESKKYLESALKNCKGTTYEAQIQALL